ncbi:UDP-glucose--hexose-1-phosphate uridylyltransferase [Treponema brennaborense]|uniref:Galactose-1-phosphate uridylyltransferase n=1 Tax=Treponema brennaborense (strain DSM 12168 / CIP 105900 / DD5/3) TaxID=906968 RepID=F4LMB1_TREBD|nr:UDP-glucose--hexose-1-phosphate uridylyltransferase [Treponema brennaborense]AEE17777.1 Galactose-1-phosphate uridylyltransferase [Treponema brennaborense DSM 12168]
MIYQLIQELTEYGLSRALIQPQDRIYTVNRLFTLFKLAGSSEALPAPRRIPAGSKTIALEPILTRMLDYAYEHGLIEENSVVYRDLFDTQIMACLTPPPSAVIREFNERYNVSPERATEWFYEYSCNTDYIRRYRIAKDIKWTVSTEYGELDITINLSKPEKDPKAIAAAKSNPQTGYPKCQLCVENEGYGGRLDHPARATHRIIPVTINGSQWGFQYSPYVYYNEHCIVLNSEHTPMVIDRAAFVKLFDFVRQFPHYIVGSNADLPIVGGSILSHEHFQGGNYEFPMARAEIETQFSMKAFPDVHAGIVKWPMSVIRLRHEDPARLVEAADLILTKWRKYTDADAFVFAETDGIPHNTITPIARRRGAEYEIDLALRNNITTEEHPLGVFHPHQNLHHIKKENIGLIEVMGLAILPARLERELELLADYLVCKKDIRSNETIAKHADWAETFAAECTAANVRDVLKRETGLVFKQVLTDAGVYKRTPEGKEAFLRFTRTL